jgi:hypothetical protein
MAPLPIPPDGKLSRIGKITSEMTGMTIKRNILNEHGVDRRIRAYKMNAPFSLVKIGQELRPTGTLNA